jgi:hypothetical protein
MGARRELDEIGGEGRTPNREESICKERSARSGGGEEEQEGGAAGEMFPAAGDLENFVSLIWLPAGTAAAVAPRADGCGHVFVSSVK